ncbi:MAG TPA: four helix bundle protein [Bacillota bacterium]|nr:four helix bundle protein [Bacillota bacterium]
MAKIEKFEDIESWRQARDLVKSIYKLTQKTSFNKDYGLKNQIQRAAVSVMSNIAEGFERGSNNEFVFFLYVAKASAGEVRSLLYTAFDLGYLDKEEFDNLFSGIVKISQTISGLIKYLKVSKCKGELKANKQ